MPRFDIYKNGLLLLQAKFADDEFVWIGRGGDCQISLNDIEISRKHVVIHRTGEAWEIRNEGRNGTRLNSERLQEPASLHYGDRIYLGNHALVFQSDEAPVLKQGASLAEATKTVPTRVPGKDDGLA